MMCSHTLGGRNFRDRATSRNAPNPTKKNVSVLSDSEVGTGPAEAGCSAGAGVGYGVGALRRGVDRIEVL